MGAFWSSCPSCGMLNAPARENCRVCGHALSRPAADTRDPPEGSAPPPRDRLSGRSARTAERMGWYRLAGVAVVLVCLFLYHLLPSPSPDYQPTAPDYLATDDAGQTATQAAQPPARGLTYALAWSPDGTRIASGGDDGEVRIWDAHTAKILLGYVGGRGSYPVSALAWSPDGRKMASVGPAGLYEVWDATSGQTITVYGTGSLSPRALAWSPDGTRIASAGANGTVQVWEATTGKTLLTYQGQNAVVESIAWSPDGKRLASAGSTGLVEVWDATSGGLRYVDHRHTGTVEQIAWSPDGTRIASASADHTVQVWDATTGRRLTCGQSYGSLQGAGSLCVATALHLVPQEIPHQPQAGAEALHAPQGRAEGRQEGLCCLGRGHRPVALVLSGPRNEAELPPALVQEPLAPSLSGIGQSGKVCLAHAEGRVDGHHPRSHL